MRQITPFEPLPWQVKPWRDMSPELLLTGSAGGGKSRLAAEKIHAYCLKYPNAMALMVRKTRNSMTNSTVLFMDRAVIGKDSHVTHYSSKNRFEYDNGSILAYGGMANEEQREQLRSIGQDGSLDIVWIEEANKITEDDFNELLARIRGNAAPWCQIILTTNPGAPTHWIYKRLIQGGEAKVYYSGALDNLHNPPEYIETLKKLTGVLGLRLRDGKWVQAEGAVYEEWDEAIHLIDSFPIPSSWRRYRAVDFGFTNPFVSQWWAEDDDGRLYLYREIYKTQRLVEDATKQIVNLSENESISVTVADHDAEDRATMERHGVRTVAANKDVSAGIQAVKARLRKAGDGKPRLFVFRDALVEVDRALENKKKPTCTAEEFTAYAWAESKDGKPNKEEPVKDNDHGMDAMRYMVYSLEQKPAVLELNANPFY